MFFFLLVDVVEDFVILVLNFKFNCEIFGGGGGGVKCYCKVCGIEEV